MERLIACWITVYSLSRWSSQNNLKENTDWNFLFWILHIALGRYCLNDYDANHFLWLTFAMLAYQHHGNIMSVHMHHCSLSNCFTCRSITIKQWILTDVSSVWSDLMFSLCYSSWFFIHLEASILWWNVKEPFILEEQYLYWYDKDIASSQFLRHFEKT